MALLLFFIILSALVLVHEFGHFIVAKWSGIRVDEFGLGYPPRIKKLFTWRETNFTLNWLPFGGFVKIYGENPQDLEVKLPSDSFQYKNRAIQAAVLFSGVVGNFLFAWVLLATGLMIGLPAPEGLNLTVTNARVVITEVLPHSPGEEAGLRSGDQVNRVSTNFPERGDFPNPSDERYFTADEISSIIRNSGGKPVAFYLGRGYEKKLIRIIVEPKFNDESLNYEVGIVMDTVGKVKLLFWSSIREGLNISVLLTVETTKGLGRFISQALMGEADFSTVAGPVGLVGMVGDVSHLGLGHLLAFTALISINLCVINLMPFPALDGGRLLFVAIEAVSRRQIPARVFNLINAAGFTLLILLMIFITVHDVRNIF